jgi:hypothetical protein
MPCPHPADGGRAVEDLRELRNGRGINSRFQTGCGDVVSVRGARLRFLRHSHAKSRPIPEGRPGPVASWIALRIGHRWDAEPDWVDRLGRAMGAFWIVTGFAGWVFYCGGIRADLPDWCTFR